MGLSTFDIPTEFLYPEKRQAFLNWLASIPTPRSAKRKILQTWSVATGYKLNAAEYLLALSSPPGRLHHAS